MKHGRKIKVVISTLALLVTGVLLLFVVLNITGEKKTNIIKILPNEADVSIQDFVFTEVGRDNMRWEVRSDNARYEKNQNLAVFDQVRVKLTMPDGKVIVMTGDRGEMITDKKELEIKKSIPARPLSWRVNGSAFRARASRFSLKRASLSFRQPSEAEFIEQECL